MEPDDFDDFFGYRTDLDHDSPRRWLCAGCGGFDDECVCDRDDDRMDCGTCDGCIDRSIAAAEEFDLGGES